jgi:hypothetical protein
MKMHRSGSKVPWSRVRFWGEWAGLAHTPNILDFPLDRGRSVSL